MIELAALITAVGVMAAFLLGYWLADKRSKDEIRRLAEQNQDLQGSLFHRIGYTPQVMTNLKEPVVEREMEQGDEKPHQQVHNQVTVDLFQRRQEAFARDILGNR
ncbi:hypothetical protein [Geitlerinema calcuttense]|uniref:Uncharacterized protein n=1 Tax=Geitlerinema calcuttense NRMC-F 0142 TaxID=2922238 RepID=A0ABT7LUY3_9CYAN|nr:hypothetical protein [Geitlerinema calcuttense]MDL5055882.1 hypothetical protein [Geitlerinema calcuttense NRMC-F 0142]